jgi:enterochelin esterase family protein
MCFRFAEVVLAPAIVAICQPVPLYVKKHGFTPVFKESDGGHTWINWRDYLAEFAPQLFPGK